MRQTLAQVSRTQLLEDGLQQLELAAPDFHAAWQPGQFALARLVASWEPYLRTVLFPVASRPGGLDLWVQPPGLSIAWAGTPHRSDIQAGSERPEGQPPEYSLQAVEPRMEMDWLSTGSSKLAELQPGDALDLIGPLGRGFRLDQPTRNLLILVAADPLPLVAIARQAAEWKKAVTWVMPAGALPISLLPAEVEIRLAPASGLALDDLAAELTWADQLIAHGPRAWYRVLADWIRAVRVQAPAGFAQVILAPPMPCGVGACGGCAVPFGRGSGLACLEGPVFDLTQVVGDH